MPDAKALAQLRDIHLPEPIGWWPLAPGWYGLAVLMIVAILLVTLTLRQRHLNTRPKHAALRQLNSFQTSYYSDPNASLMSAQISELLKRVALAYYPRKQVASLQGELWIHFLNETSRHIDFNQVKFELLELPYLHGVDAIQQSTPAPTSSNLDLSLLFKLSKQWIDQRRKPCLN